MINRYISLLHLSIDKSYKLWLRKQLWLYSVFCYTSRYKLGRRNLGRHNLTPMQMRSRCSIASLRLVNPYPTRQNYQTIFHLLSVLYNYTTVSKILEIQITLISEAQGAKDPVVVEVHYPLLLRFQIFDLHRLCCISNELSILELHKGIFCLKSQ